MYIRNIENKFNSIQFNSILADGGGGSLGSSGTGDGLLSGGHGLFCNTGAGLGFVIGLTSCFVGFLIKE